MTKITISNQSHKSYRKYKSENGRTRTSEYIRSGIRCHGGVSIPCWPVTPAVSPISTFDQCVKNGLTIGMKHIRQHVAQRKVVWANKIVVTTIKFAESCLYTRHLKPLWHQLICQYKSKLSNDFRHNNYLYTQVCHVLRNNIWGVSVRFVDNLDKNCQVML
jgi:ribosomal protein S17E